MLANAVKCSLKKHVWYFLNVEELFKCIIHFWLTQTVLFCTLSISAAPCMNTENDRQATQASAMESHKAFLFTVNASSESWIFAALPSPAIFCTRRNLTGSIYHKWRQTDILRDGVNLGGWWVSPGKNSNMCLLQNKQDLSLMVMLVILIFKIYFLGTKEKMRVCACLFSI